MANNVNNGITGVIDIPGALRSRGAADGNLVGGVVAYAGDIYDVTLDKNLAEVNSGFTEAIDDINDNISSIQDDISPFTGSANLQSLVEYDKIEVSEGINASQNNEVYINDKKLAMSFGYNNTISNDRKLAFGFGQQLNVPDNTFVIGQRNSYEPNAAFIVGNGTLNGSTNNAFVIGRDGNFWVYGINGYAGQLTGTSQYNSVNHFITGLDTRLTALEGIVLTGDNIVIATSPYSEFYSTNKGAEGNVIIGSAGIIYGTSLLYDQGSFKRNVIVGNSNTLNNCDRTAISGSVIFGNNNNVTGGICIGVNNTNQSTSDKRWVFTLLGTRLTAGDSNNVTYNYNFIPNATVIGVNNNPTTFNGIYSSYQNGDWTDAGAFEVGAGKNNTSVSILAQKSDGNLYIKGVGGWDGMSSVKNKKSINTIISEFETRIAALESQIAALTNN